MTKEEALQKIRKLLKRDGRTNAEADTAQMLAALLAEKHKIDLEDAARTDSEAVTPLTHRVVKTWGKLPDEATFASLICQRFFEIQALHRGTSYYDEMIFIGTEPDLVIAEYVFAFLIGEFRRSWNRRHTRSKARKAFIYGCFLAVWAKLEERFGVQTQPGLVVSKKARREAYMAENWPNTKTSEIKPKAARGEAVKHGMRAGWGIEIRPGVAAAPKRTPLGEGPKLLGSGRGQLQLL